MIVFIFKMLCGIGREAAHYGRLIHVNISRDTGGAPKILRNLRLG